MTGISLSMVKIAKEKKIPYCIYAFDEQFSRVDEDFFIRQIRKINKSYRTKFRKYNFCFKFFEKEFFNSIANQKIEKSFK